MTDIKANDMQTNNELKNEKEKTVSTPQTMNNSSMLSPHSISIDHSILNNEALYELENAALFLLDDDDDHQILSSSTSEEDTKATTIELNNFLMNAVHMEVQENAKVSTLPVSINRSKNNSNNFVNKPYYVREMLNREKSLTVDGSSGLDDAKIATDDHTFVEGVKLAEMFLHSNERYI